MAELTVPQSMYDKSLLFTNQEDKEAASKLIDQIGQSMGFFKMCIDQFEPRKSDAFTHLGLMESYLAELSKLTDYDGMVAKEYEKRYAEIKAANTRIHELEAMLGSQVSGAAVSAGIRHWENVFRAWYEAAGFHYAEVTMGPYVIRANFDDELENEPGQRHLATQELLDKVKGHVHFITSDEDWDIEHDQFHSNLLDTHANKLNLIQLFTDSFPKANITEFRARKDGGKYYLHFSVVILWEDLDAWWSSIQDTEKTDTDTKTEEQSD